MSESNRPSYLEPLRDEHLSSLAALRIANHSDLHAVSPGASDRPPNVDELADSLRRLLDDDVTRQSFVICVGAEIVGALNFTDIVRGPKQSTNIGFWVDKNMRGRGIATQAIADALSFAFGVLRLHRIEAGVQPNNAPSLTALRSNGFTEIGVASEYLFVAGRWQDHVLLERLARA